MNVNMQPILNAKPGSKSIAHRRCCAKGPLMAAAAGFAFVYMRDYRDAEDAIRGLDRSVDSGP